MKRMMALIVFLSWCVVISGCASTRVKRVDVDETIDFSGRWNDSDSRMTAAEIIQDCLSRDWADGFREQKGRKPVVIVGELKNKTDEHINVDVFIKDLERALINSGKVRFVASRDERGGVRQERLDQNQEGFTDPETIKQIGKETGADFMLIGSLNTIKDETSGRYVILYQVNTELIDLVTNEKIWIGQNLLKKVVTKSKYSL